jgi:hypothetical protein
MRYFIAIATSTFLAATGGQALAGSFPQAGFSRGDGAPIILVQEKPKKDETLKQKVTRVWKNIAGYKFDVNCPINYHRSCAETGKSVGDARAKCIARNSGCWVSDIN